jgi:WD40 repeat protein
MIRWLTLANPIRRWRGLSLLAFAVIVLAAGGRYLWVNEAGSTELGLRVAKLRSVVTKGSPTGIAWSPNGEKIAAIHDLGRAISVWDSVGKPIVSIKRDVTTGPYVGTSLAFMPDNRTIIGPAPTPNLGEYSSLGLWDADSGALQTVVPAPSSNKISQLVVAKIFALSPDGALVALRPIHDVEPITIYRTSDWSVVRIRPIFKSETLGLRSSQTDFPDIVNSLAFSPNNDLAAGLMDGLVIMGADPSSTPLRFIESTFEKDSRPVQSLAYSPDGKFVATGVSIAHSLSASAFAAHLPYLQIRDVASGRVVIEDSSIGNVRQLSWDSDGQILAVITIDEAVHLYRPFTSGGVHQDIPVAKGAYTLSFSPTKSELAISSQTGIDIYSIRLR